ncbi:Peptidyl-prolyl cis-trans isomerase D [Trichinella nelsoni]|uniref:Peptidyl-prolyl cis-trans isomerase D n=1 Tax=Trichinella nelsoni TaxID=6336 RepID=A0A0V0RYX1_9BILA|nr:Peptidyl-prolyl cis-trans isomerase D [Trichinella nelsoni]
MNTSQVDLLYITVEIGTEPFGTFFIEPFVPASENLLVQMFKFFHNNPASMPYVGGVLKVCRLRSVEFAWSSSINEAFLILSQQGNPFIHLIPPSIHSFMKDLDLAAKEQAYFVGLSENITNPNALPQMVVFTSHWAAYEFKGILVGRIFKGGDLIMHLATLDTDLSGSPNKSVNISETGVVPSGFPFKVKTPDALLDIFPDSPSEAAINFADPTKLMNVVYAIKSSGNLLFRQERYQMAIARFSKAIRYINYACIYNRPNGELESKMVSLVVSCILHSAFCKIRLKDFSGALEDCNEALELDPSNYKAYYRRGQAYHGKLYHERSLFDLFTALRIAPMDKATKSQIAAVSGEIQVYKKKRLRSLQADQNAQSCGASTSGLQQEQR